MTVNRQTLEGNWNEIKGKLHEKWGQITDDELQTARGNIEQLVGLIQRRTGETRDSVMQYLEQLTSGEGEGGSTLGRARESVKEYAQHATETAQQTAQQAAESMRAGYHQTEELVRRRPVESLAVCFGAGLLTGLIVGLSMRSR